ncbi:hypothetical protein RND81_09G250000 [Saponaria officinalis]|uniref:Omega-hydroxypalmitate O-feruloyl transferase n=1 Tax=Saponaria officinalis TaxID=3572 RepID=A0AAW1IR55_SAPOF
MGTPYNQGSTSLVKDLKVTIQDSTLIFCPQEIEKKSMFLSSIDQVLNFDVQTLHFFTKNPSYPPKEVFKMIKSALEKLLVPYFFLGGRIKTNSETGRLEIECKNGGIGFVEASSECTLDELGDLVYPNPSFEQLVTKKMSFENVDDHPLCIVQMTAFKCGGFAMGLQTNHITFDGISTKYFLQNLAALSADKPLAIIPCNQRELLAARSPPRVTFPHPELVDLKIPIGQDDGGESHEQNPNIFYNYSQPLDLNIFSLSSDHILNLKAKAKNDNDNDNDNDNENDNKVTGFNVISGLVWRCKALSCNNNKEDSKDRLSTILFAIDIRSKLNPPLPPSYTGNAVLTAYATASCKELEEASLSRLVELVSEGVSRMTDEYARSAIDWGELYKGFPKGEFLLSSWWKLGFNLVEYSWGKPKYSCPLVYHRKDIILLFPHIDESKGGVNVLVALPHDEMLKFQALFHNFLAN